MLFSLLRCAYPRATIYLAGGQHKNAEMKSVGNHEKVSSIHFLAEPSFPDKDTLYLHYMIRHKAIERVLEEIGETPDLIILSSCSPTALSVFSKLRLASRCAASIHGNANELGGWRSSTPYVGILI